MLPHPVFYQVRHGTHLRALRMDVTSVIMLFLWGFGGKVGYDMNTPKPFEDTGRALSADIFNFGGIMFGSFSGIIPAFTAVARTSTARLPEFHLQQLAILVGIIKQHIRNYMPEVFGFVTELWETPPCAP
ncbi:hypothetical protein BDR05DRAFT_645987 [Suillus weaverae]|nr:hypothetical protein BDR05DRAFT_645987 [Suillus weaverae]